nr:CMF_HP1_G0048420.mRNA.1.CDS.1 [Saccharomyces cerevisiae]
MFSCITALALPVDNKRASDSLDLKKKYAPDPPITHNVNIGIVFTDPEKFGRGRPSHNNRLMRDYGAQDSNDFCPVC